MVNERQSRAQRTSSAAALCSVGCSDLLGSIGVPTTVTASSEINMPVSIKPRGAECARWLPPAPSSHARLDTSRGSDSRLLSRHRGRVMVYDQPSPVAISVDKAESCRAGDRFPVAVLGKRVGPGVDCHVSVDPNPLLADDNLVGRGNGLEDLEVVTNGGRGVTERGRPRAPQHRLRIIKSN